MIYSVIDLIKIMCAILMVFIGLYPVEVQSQPIHNGGDAVRTHFIVAIDVSNDMKIATKDKKITEKAISYALFEGIKGKKESKLKTFNSETDIITIINFVLTGAASSVCKENVGFEILPETLFSQLPLIKQPNNKDELEKSIGAAVTRNCMFLQDKNYSPIVTAETLSPIFVNKIYKNMINNDYLFDKTILIVVSNDVYNGYPTRELDDLRRNRGLPLLRMEDGLALMRQVSQHFLLEPLGGGVNTAEIRDGQFTGLQLGAADYGRNTVRLHMSELKPLGTGVANAVDFPKVLSYDRVAYGEDNVRVVAAAGERDDLRVLSQPRLEPLNIQIRQVKGGFDGSPSNKVIDLSSCSPPVCVRKNGFISIDPFAALGETRTQGREDQPLPAQSFEARVAFRYKTDGIYDLARIHSDWAPVQMRMVPPIIIPGSSWSPEERRLDNYTLTVLWRSSDKNGLTQDIARERLLVERENEEKLLSAAVIGGAILGTMLLGSIFLILFYRRPFHPMLSWHGVDNPILDFDDDGQNRLLLGVVTIENEARPPWFGRLMGNQEHPHRPASLKIDVSALSEAGFEVEGNHPIGFLSPTASEGLSVAIERDVTHGNQFPIFLATEQIRDFSSDDLSPTQAVEITLSFTLSWRRRRADAEWDAVNGALMSLSLRRERPRAPRIQFVHNTDAPVVFEQGLKKEVGRFQIESQNRRKFAETFVASYAISARRTGVPLSDDILSIPDALGVLSVPSREMLRLPLFLNCDGVEALNPESAEDVYTFRLTTEAAANSNLGPYSFRLSRDPALCEPRLVFEWCGQTYSVFWPDAGRHASAVVVARGDEMLARTVPLEGDILALPSPTAGVRTVALAEGGAAELLRINFGNTGRSGRGAVDFEWRWSLEEDPAALAIEMKPGRTLVDALALRDDLTGALVGLSSLNIAETDEDRLLHVAVEHGAVAKIHGDRSGVLDFMCRIAVRRRNDLGETWSGEVTVAAKFRVETLPPPNWLCIDFGTSAVAAALGAGDSVKLINLQRVVPPDADVAILQERNIESYDPANLERDTPFLPSYAVCDADFRQSRATKHAKPGFPAYSPAKLRPSDPTFLALPAPVVRLQSYPDRVIGSLKSWLGRSAANITLGCDVPFIDASGNRVEGAPPTDEVVEGAFAALASAYLDNPLNRAGRIIITHPNTFSPVHRDRLRRCALNGLGARLGVHLAERFELISESDAIAFHHCRSRLRQGAVNPEERVLVFDLGAGTLDLTLIKVDWAVGEHVRPLRWTVENRIGVPVAGNHLDRILAWQVDRLLRSPSIVDEKRFKYVFPLVSRGFAIRESQNDHREAVRELARALRQAKQGDPGRSIPAWDGKSPFKVKVGGNGPHLLRAINEAAMKALPAESDGSAPQLLHRDGEIVLAIPADLIHGDKALKAFLKFLTRTCVDETLAGAGRTRDDVHTVLVSGRGALWPGLRDAVVGQFPKAEAPILHNKPNEMKEAVVRGAIAWQQLTGAARSVTDQRPPRLALLLKGDNRLIEEKDWDKPVDLSTSASFSLIQVECADPDYQRDSATLRRHFYVDIGFGELQREELCAGDPMLRIRRERDHAGYVAIRLEGGGNSKTLGVAGTTGAIAMRPPWPIGETLLNPDESPEEE